MPDIRQTPEYARYLEKIGWIVEINNKTNYFIRKIPLLGRILKIQRPLKLDFAVINRLQKKYRVSQTIIEPLSQTKSIPKGFVLSRNTFLPSKTLVLDLEKSKGEIFQGLHKDARYAINKNINTKVKEFGVQPFRTVWKRTVGLKRFVPPLSHLQALKKAFGDNALFLIDQENTAGAIFLIGNKTGYYWQAFTNRVGRKRFRQYKIVWEGIVWAKKGGCKQFDFEGIFDQRFPNKSWLGFSHFKKSFGGKEVSYPGCFVKTDLFRLKKL